MPLMVANLALWHTPPAQVVLVGTPGADDFTALERVLARHYLPAAVTIERQPGQKDGTIAARLAWLGAMDVADGRAAAYRLSEFHVPGAHHRPGDAGRRAEGPLVAASDHRVRDIIALPHGVSRRSRPQGP